MPVDVWTGFVAIALIATIVPGPAVILVSSHSLAYGVRKTFPTILGNVTGLFVMSLLSIFGLSLILMNSIFLFSILKLAGAGYLIYLGVRVWNSRRDVVDGNSSGANASILRSGSRLYVDGIILALTNPKAIAFTTALFPQFIDPAQEILPQFLVMVFTLMSLSFLCLLAYAFFVNRVVNTSENPSIYTKVTNRLFGSILIISGGMLALSSKGGQ